MASTTEYLNEDAGKDAGDIGAKIEELRAEMARLTEQVQIFLQDRAGDLRDSAAETTAEIEEMIRENPFPAVGIALGVGFILGLMVRGGRAEGREPTRLSRRDFDRLTSRLRGAIEAGGARAQAAAADADDSALLERLAGAISGLVAASRSTAASVGSAGEKAAKSVAAAGERTARSIADRLSQAVH